MQKGQWTEDKTCIKLSPGRLCAQMEIHKRSLPPSAFIIYSSNTRQAFLGRGSMTPWSLGTGGTCDSFSLNIIILGKTAMLHLAHFCSWGCANQACNYWIQLYLVHSTVWGCAKFKHAAYSIYLSAPNILLVISLHGWHALVCGISCLWIQHIWSPIVAGMEALKADKTNLWPTYISILIKMNCCHGSGLM
jgi:hypothetical protein